MTISFNHGRGPKPTTTTPATSQKDVTTATASKPQFNGLASGSEGHRSPLLQAVHHSILGAVRTLE